MFARGRHRARQFLGALRPHISDADRADANRYLNPAQQAVFESMMLRDQQHGIEVYRRVREATADDDPALFTAALLHDCGKGRVVLWQRVAHVLLSAAAPPVEPWLASKGGAEWRRALYRLRHHPEIGARMVAATGADGDVVRMIREQDTATLDARLTLLQAADEA